MFRKISSMRVLLIVFSLTLITVLGTSSLALGAATTKSLSSNYTLVNLSTCVAPATCDAAVTVKYLTDTGATWNADPGNTNFNVPGNYGSVVVRQYFDTTLSEGRGSVVVSSGEPLGSVVQLQTRGAQIPSKGAYVGVSQGSSKFYVPIAEKFRSTSSGIGNSQIIVQNADSVTITALTIDLIQGSTVVFEKTLPSALAPGQSFFFDLTDEPDANIPTNWVGSAVVTAVTPATAKLAVVSNFFLGPDAMQSFNAFPAESVTPKWIAPLFFSQLANNLSTVVTVQNLSGGQIAAGGITLSCIEDTANFTNTYTTFQVSTPAVLNNNEEYSFNPVVNADNLFPLTTWGDKWGGSCTIDAGSANIVAIVQMRYVGNGKTMAAGYEAIPVNGSTNRTMVVPLVAERLSNGFASVVTIQNMSTTAIAHVHLKYTPSFINSDCPVNICDTNSDGIVDGNDAIQYDMTIPAGASIQRNHRLGMNSTSAQAEILLKDGWQGSLVVVSSDQPINGFVQLTDYLHLSGDTFMAHDVFTLP